MRIGVCFLPEIDWHEQQHQWAAAEEMGLAHAWTYDHLIWGGLPDSPWHSTVATLTAAAMVTSRIQLGPFVASPNFRHPVTFTRDIVTLDRMSQGRLLLGLGAGGDLDANVLGEELTRGQRTRRFGEFVHLLDRMLTEDGVDYQGEFFAAAGARSTPGCWQQPRVPFVVAANGPRAQRLAAQYGQGWLTTGPVSGPPQEPASPTEGVQQWWQGTADVVASFDSAAAANAAEPAHAQGGKPRRYLSLDACGVPALSSVDFCEEQIGRAAELGFTDVVVHWPRATPPYRAKVATLEEIASRY